MTDQFQQKFFQDSVRNFLTESSIQQFYQSHVNSKTDTNTNKNGHQAKKILHDSKKPLLCYYLLEFVFSLEKNFKVLNSSKFLMKIFSEIVHKEDSVVHQFISKEFGKVMH
jgi:hypothetical protein